MFRSEATNELALALSKSQGEMSPAIKDSTNPFFKSKYADLTSVWSACREPLSKNGFAVTQTTVEKDGRLMLVTTLLHSSGQWIESYLPITPQKPDPQSLGAAITYMRRFALCAMVGICPEDDDGNSASGRTVISPVPAKVSREKADVLIKKLDLVPHYKVQIKEWLSKQGINDLMDVHESMFDGIVRGADKASDQQLTEKTA